ncbi:MAG TPA: hypothetical protein VNL13_00945 [Sulfolobales archaeon]|nr:hypothetical protein [Sulfolobales archaeon]
MSLSFVGRVDFKGRITIPLPIRDLLGMYEGTTVMIYADLDERSIEIKPVQAMGVLAKISRECGERSCIGELIARLEKLEGFKDLVEIRCTRNPKGYRCYAIALIGQQYIEKLKSSEGYTIEILK